MLSRVACLYFSGSGPYCIGVASGRAGRAFALPIVSISISNWLFHAISFERKVFPRNPRVKIQEKPTIKLYVPYFVRAMSTLEW